MDDNELRDLAASACQEALSFGVNEDVFLRLAQSVRARCTADTAEADPRTAPEQDVLDARRWRAVRQRYARALCRLATGGADYSSVRAPTVLDEWADAAQAEIKAFDPERWKAVDLPARIAELEHQAGAAAPSAEKEKTEAGGPPRRLRPPQPMVEKTFSMPDSHLLVLEAEAARMELSVDQALMQAIRLYQAVNHGGFPHMPLREDSPLRLFKDELDSQPSADAPAHSPDTPQTPLQRWESFRDEMAGMEQRMGRLAKNFLDCGAWEDAAKCALKAEGMRWVVGRMPAKP